jgi:hypothetical protein
MDIMGLLDIFWFFVLAGITSSVVLVCSGLYSFWFVCALQIILIILLQGATIANTILYCSSGAALFIPISLDRWRFQGFFPILGIIVGALLSTIVLLAIINSLWFIVYR